MKRIISLILIMLFLVGCTAVQPIDTENNATDDTIAPATDATVGTSDATNDLTEDTQISTSPQNTEANIDSTSDSSDFATESSSPNTDTSESDSSTADPSESDSSTAAPSESDSSTAAPSESNSSTSAPIQNETSAPDPTRGKLLLAKNNVAAYKVVSFFGACSEISVFTTKLKAKTGASFSVTYNPTTVGGKQIVVGSYESLSRYLGAPKARIESGGDISVVGSVIYIASIDTNRLSKILDIFLSKVTLLTDRQYGISSNLSVVDDKYRIKELIVDNDFSDGMVVRSNKDHSNNDAWSDLGNFTYGKNVTPKWTLCQWDSGRCIWGSRVSSASNTLTDGVSKWVTYNPTEKSLLLRLNTNDYYKGNGAVQGDYWPHLLVEQNFAYSKEAEADKVFYTGAADKWQLSFDLRMPNYSFTNHGGWVNAAQLYIYLGAHHKPTGRFIWFGVQVFDSRWKNNSDTHYAVDGGKGDATGNMIYCVGMKELYKGMSSSFWGDSSPRVTNNYIHFEIDMIPHLQDMINRGISEQNLPSGTKISDFYIDYMNYGWEIIGTYDCGVEIKNLSLMSYIEN